MAKNKENRLVVGDIGWAESIPKWLLEEVKFERVAMGLGGLINPNAPKVGDAEICVYLMTASLRQPLSPEHTNIYMYLVTRLFKKRNKEVPGDIRKDELTEEEEHEFKKLKDMLYQKRGGEIHHPLLDIMRNLKKGIEREGASNNGKEKGKASTKAQPK